MEQYGDAVRSVNESDTVAGFSLIADDNRILKLMCDIHHISNSSNGIS